MLEKNTLWSLQVVSKLGVLANFELYQVLMCWIVLNNFQSIFWNKTSQYQTWNILNYILHAYFFVLKWYNIHKDFLTISSLCMTKCLNTSELYTTGALKALLRKNRFCFFFLIFWHAKIPLSSRMPRCWH